MRIVCLSDTHGVHDIDIPDGDVFLYAGDMCRRGTQEELIDFRDNLLHPLDHDHKIIVAGNHDWPLYHAENPSQQFDNCCYLEDSAVVVGGLKIYGTPWQPEFHNWAYNLPRGQTLADKWAQIPTDTDILITHGPPKNIKDHVYRGMGRMSCMKSVGSKTLLERVLEVDPQLHVFGHIHECGGIDARFGTTFLNASYQGAGHAPYVFDVDESGLHHVDD
jgi:Icc-related predicted phosphoesterase